MASEPAQECEKIGRKALAIVVAKNRFHFAVAGMLPFVMY
jgi:hypothetical protein